MKLQIQADLGGVTRKMDLVIDSLSHLDRALKRLGAYLRLKARKKFNEQGPGWAPLAASTIEHRKQADLKGLESKLTKELDKAWSKESTKASAIKRRMNVLDELHRLKKGAQGQSLLKPKQAEALNKRIGRGKKQSGKVLGKIANSIKAKVSKSTLEVSSKIPWSGVHNDGGTAGHGAPIPKREFLALDEDDLEAFENFILDEVEKGLGE